MVQGTPRQGLGLVCVQGVTPVVQVMSARPAADMPLPPCKGPEVPTIMMVVTWH